MERDEPFKSWLTNARNKQVAELFWLIKNAEAKINLVLSSQKNGIDKQHIISELNYCISLYQKLSHYYPPVDISPAKNVTLNTEPQAILSEWLEQSRQLMQSSHSDEKATCIAHVLDRLNKLILFHQHNNASLATAQSGQPLSSERLSTWFLSLIDLIRHQQDNPAWANDFFHHLSTSAYQDLYQMLAHSDIAHFMFHIYYYKLFPDQLSKHSKHPDLLVSIDQRLTFLYQRIEQFVETFILFSKNYYQLAPKDFLCHGNQLPKGITLRSKEVYRQLIIEGLKKLNRKAPITSQTPTAEIIDALFRSYQFWFNPKRLLDAIFMLCNRLKLSISDEMDKTLYNHMLNAFHSIETEACVNLYGYFSNNDTRYLLRVLDFLGSGGSIQQIPSLTEDHRRLIGFIYQALSQVIDALTETLNQRNLPCNAIRVAHSTKPPSPSKRNLQAILHVIAIYGNSSEPIPCLDSLFAELERDISGGV